MHRPDRHTPDVNRTAAAALQAPPRRRSEVLLPLYRRLAADLGIRPLGLADADREVAITPSGTDTESLAVLGELTPKPNGDEGFTASADEWPGRMWRGEEGVEV
jgi:hypothetical protein